MSKPNLFDLLWVPRKGYAESKWDRLIHPRPTRRSVELLPASYPSPKRRRRGQQNQSIKNALSRALYIHGEPLACHWCGAEMEYRALTVDHVVALFEDGRDHVSNCVLACPECNGIRNMQMQERLGLRKKPAPAIPNRRAS